MQLQSAALGGANVTNATEPKAGHLLRRVLGVLLLLASGGAVGVSAQEPPTRENERNPGFKLEQNYPNPFNPETRIPFVLEESLFEDGEPPTVSIRILNILLQYVDSPVALSVPDGEGLPLLQVEYPAPGRYEAYWDGRDRNGNLVASGVYLVQLIVDGETDIMKMYVTK